MCPSYMATREEAHSTRGRAHLIYEALTSDLLPGGFADPALHEALELCLSCKACKSECPASVDMAAYKAEFLANFYESHRRTLPVQFFGRIHEIARAGSFAPNVLNAMQRGSAARSCATFCGSIPNAICHRSRINRSGDGSLTGSKRAKPGMVRSESLPLTRGRLGGGRLLLPILSSAHPFLRRSGHRFCFSLTRSLISLNPKWPSPLPRCWNVPASR